MLANQCIHSRLPLIAVSDASNAVPPRPRLPQQAPLMAAAAATATAAVGAGVAEDAGAVVARLNGTEVTSAAGDENATGVISLAVFQSGSDYNIRYGASIRLTAPGAPLSIAIRTGAAGSADSGAALLEFSATEAAWANLTWNGTRRDPRGRRHAAPIPKYFGFFSPGVPSGYVYGFSGVWYNATQYSNAAGQSYFEVANLLLANPSGYFGIVKTEAFADGAARGQFANFTRPTPDTFWQRN
ncbi:unnamed protein product [Closterium sp. Yama58-4]|nr:unnamed protein product [Closterium sp. Yama58-4]